MIRTRRGWIGAAAAACLAFAGCGGGGGGGDAPGYTPATSTSFSPTTARSAAGQNVALHWVYAVNSGQAVTASLGGLSVGIAVTAVEVTLSPGDLTRRVSGNGSVTASSGGVAYAGNYTFTATEGLAQASGKTLAQSSTFDIGLTLSGGGETASASVTSSVTGFSPPIEWLPDNATLDQLPIGTTRTIAGSGTGSFNVTITGTSPIVRNNIATTVSDTWTVVDKLASMTVRGRTYANVVELTRLTSVPNTSGGMSPVTMTYWVAKGVGMIRGIGIYRVLNVDTVVYELTDTNLGGTV